METHASQDKEHAEHASQTKEIPQIAEIVISGGDKYWYVMFFPTLVWPMAFLQT